MILFVFEGQRREPALFMTMKHLFLPKNDQMIICSYGNHIYDLYRRMNETEEPEDIITILKKKLINDKDNGLTEIRRRSDFSQVYLFFDYDPQNEENIESSNIKIHQMLEFFNDESSDYGKLFINYPMVESIRYFRKELPDFDYYSYTCACSIGRKFKEKVAREAFYKNLDFIAFKVNTRTDDITVPADNESIESIRRNWNTVRELNVRKANYICTGNNTVPDHVETIDQRIIFENQIVKYIKPLEEISILNSFPLFLFEYCKNIGGV